LYYALYSKPAPFIDYTARLLFNEAVAVGHPPVSIPGTGYDLIEITSPDPEQIITLETFLEENKEEPQDIYQVGDLIQIITNMIIDANGNQVPDGTPVEFTLNYQAETIPPLVLATTTERGKAYVTITLDRPGIILIGAETSTARLSELKQITVQGEFIEQTAVPTGEEQTEEPIVAGTQLPTELPEVVGTIDLGSSEETQSTFRTEEFILGLLGIFIIVGIGYSIASLRYAESPNRVRYAFITAIGALFGYNYLSLGLPGSEGLISQIGQIASLVSSFAGGGIGLLVALYFIQKEKVT
jgi:hypothetical protein